MGSSCTSGKKSEKRTKNNSNTTTTTQTPKKQMPKDVPSVFFQQSMKDNIIGCNDQTSEIDNKTTQKIYKKYLVVQNDSTGVKSSTSNNCLTASSSNKTMKTNSTTSTPSQKSVSPQSDLTSSSKKKRVSQLENFILERKKYMNNRGVVVYTPYTLLPPPILKNIQSSTLSRKRFASLSDESFLKSIQDNRKKSIPTNMLHGDTDQVIIEV